jgi:hypothetical protein
MTSLKDCHQVLTRLFSPFPFLPSHLRGKTKFKKQRNMANLSSAVEDLASSVISVFTSFFHLIFAIFNSVLSLIQQAFHVALSVGSSALSAVAGLFSSVAGFVFGERNTRLSLSLPLTEKCIFLQGTSSRLPSSQPHTLRTITTPNRAARRAPRQDAASGPRSDEEFWVDWKT